MLQRHQSSCVAGGQRDSNTSLLTQSDIISERIIYLVIPPQTEGFRGYTGISLLVRIHYIGKTLIVCVANSSSSFQ